MLFHYVEDNEFDITALARTFRSCDGVRLTSSTSVEELPSNLDDGVNGILLDINRPDASSIEDDVLRVRSVCSAPIAFVTGGDVGDARSRAIAAGAEGVFEKDGLSAELVRQIFCNAQARIMPSEMPANMALKVSLDTQVRHVLDYLRQSLQSSIDLATERRCNIPPLSAYKSLDIVNVILQSDTSDGSGGPPHPLTQILAFLDEQISFAAQNANIAMAFRAPILACSELGDNYLHTLGIQHLVLSLLARMQSEETLVIAPGEGEKGLIATIECSWGNGDPLSSVLALDFEQQVNRSIGMRCLVDGDARADTLYDGNDKIQIRIIKQYS